MTWVKICGITSIDDARVAVEAGADAVGFVFYHKSPRNLDPAVARQIVQQLPEKVEKVGVFVDLSPEQQAQIVDEVGLTAVQGRLTSGTNGKIKSQNPVRRLVPMPVTLLLEDESRLQGLTAEFIRMSESRKPPIGFDTFLLDSSTPQQPGGTGKVFDWNRIAPLVHVMNKSVKVIAAGGLTPENVGEAMRILRPWGVDVSSGVEVIPGKKDTVKVRAFIQAVRNMDKN